MSGYDPNVRGDLKMGSKFTLHEWERDELLAKVKAAKTFAQLKKALVALIESLPSS